MAEQEKSYVVVYDFNDPAGKAWKAGNVYTGTEQEITAALATGNVVEGKPPEPEAQDTRRSR